MEAFQLSLGRLDELDVNAMHFKGSVPELGRKIFLQTSDGGPVAAGKCQLCHANAGANVSFRPDPQNSNFNTGVEAIANQPARELLANQRAGKVREFPIDGGFGTTPEGMFDSLKANPDGSFGNGTFNTPSLIEAADTPPFFHNNSINTIEEAVNFYNSDAFTNAPGGGQLVGPINLEPTQVEAVAAMLRVINAVENIRASNALNEEALRALGRTRKAKVDRQLALSRAEVTDGIQVLRQAGLHPDAVRHLGQARKLLKQALETNNHFKKVDFIRGAVRNLRTARADMVRA